MAKTIHDCIVFYGPELQPWRCKKFTIRPDGSTTIDRLKPVSQIDQGALVIIPSLYNSHTHMGDSFLPDGATGLTLEEGFFRPEGMKYRELDNIDPEQHLELLCASLKYMARTGTGCHIDFREQGPKGAELLREASDRTGVDSVILGQFNSVPFNQAQLDSNTAALPSESVEELNQVLRIADGFSESTMNDLTDPAWQTIKEITQDKKKLRAIHCLENEGYRDTSLRITGKGDLQRALELYAPHIIVHMTVANQREIELLSQSGITAVLNPRANANLGLPLPPIHALMQSHANLLLGTDNGLLNSPNLFAELDFSYKLAKSQARDPRFPDPLHILRMATSNIRSAIGGDHYGYLETDKPANFVVLNFHQAHLSRSRHLAASVLTRVTPEDVLANYREGKAIYEHETLKPLWQ